MIRGVTEQDIEILFIFTLKDPLDRKLLLSPIAETDRRGDLIHRVAFPVMQVFENPTIN